MEKISTLKELKELFDTGKLNPLEDALILDNDCSSLYPNSDGENAENIFDKHPTEILEEALSLLGIPFNYC